MRSFFVFAHLLGCGSQAIDDTTSAPSSPQHLTILRDNAPATAWTFAETPVAAHASAMFVVRNDGIATLPSIAVTFDGPGAPAFSIDHERSTCDDAPKLVAGDYCTLELVFSRPGAGTSDASVQIASGHTVATLAVHGTAVPSPALVADVSSLDLGVVQFDGGGFQAIGLTNTSAADVSIGDISTTAGVRVDFDDCPTPLPAGASCSVSIEFIPHVLGPASGTLTIPSDANTVIVSLHAYGARAVSIGKGGSGTGRVYSFPSGIDCRSGCSAQLATIIGDVTIFEEPDDPSVFAGWSSVCGTAPSCGVPEGTTNASLAAWFEGPNAHKIAIAFAGNAIGKVVVGDTDNGFLREHTICTGSCTTYLADGTLASLVALTPSEFTGWTGACTGTARDCDLGTVSADAAATASFVKDDRELVTLLPAVPAQRVAFAPDGDLVVGGSATVSKLAIDGTVRWSIAVPNATATTNVNEIKVAASGTIYVLSEDFTTFRSTLHALSSAGVEEWAHLFDHTFVCSNQGYPTGIATAPNGDVAVQTSDGSFSNAPVVVLDSTGAMRWSGPIPLYCGAVVVDATGTYHVVAHQDPDDNLVIFQFDADGNSLPGFGPVKGSYNTAAAVDAQGALAIHSVGFFTFFDAVLERFLPTGDPAFVQLTPTDDFMGAGVGYDATGNVISVRNLEPGRAFPGIHLEQTSPAGASLWLLDKPTPIPEDPFPDGVFAVDMSIDAPRNRVAVAGNYANYLFENWIAIYQLP